MTIADAAHITQVPENTIRGWASRGLIASPRIGGVMHVSLKQMRPHVDHWHRGPARPNWTELLACLARG